MSQNNYIFLFLLLLVIFIIVLFCYSDKKESFLDFSPYYENHAYPAVYEKQKDQKAFNKTLEKWEKPFNSNDEGYYNAEPRGGPPLVPIYSYLQMNKV